jgi:cysteine synthase
VGLNPYATKGVTLQLALAHGEMRTIKEVVARNIIEEKIRAGLLKEGDTCIDATSGGTGLGYAGILQPLGIKLKLVVQGSLPIGKLNKLRVYGEGVEVISHYGPESTVARARREAEESGYVLLDQYASPHNPQAHERYTAPALWEQTGGDVAVIVAALGTCGTAMGFSRYFKGQGSDVKIIGVACDPNQRVPQIPGMRTLPEIARDVLLPWKEEVDEVRLALRPNAIWGARRLAYAEPSWPGLSTGAAYEQALEYVRENLSLLRGKRVVVMSPDSVEPYLDIMSAEQDDAQIAQALADRPVW